MSDSDTDRPESLRAGPATLFGLAGALFAVFAILWGVGAYTTVEPRPAVDVFGPAGWGAAFLGLLGLYGRLVDRTPWLARAAAVLVAVGLFGATATAAGSLAELAGLLVDPPAILDVLQLPLLVGIVPGFLAFAAAAARSDRESRRLAVLLALPALLFVVNVARVATLGPTTPQWAPFVLGSGQALALLAIGRTLQTSATRTGSADRSGSPTAR